MLDKTLRLVEQHKPGAYVNNEADIYDAEEIRQLASKLGSLIYSPSKLREKLQAHGITISPANFYAEIPTIVEIEEASAYEGEPFADGFDRDAQIKFVESLIGIAAEFDPPRQSNKDSGVFGWDNDAFSYSDAMVYYCLIRKHRPKRVLEIGSGWSSLVALAALEANGEGHLTCIEPYPMKMLQDANGIELIKKRAQDLSPDDLNDRLADGDFFFIDSTHTVKHNSDCIHIYLRLLPNIKSDIFVHVHDIRLPQTLSKEMMRDSQIYWTEQYLLYAYLMDNKRCKILYGSYFGDLHFPETLQTMMHGRWRAGGASLWFAQQQRSE